MLLDCVMPPNGEIEVVDPVVVHCKCVLQLNNAPAPNTCQSAMAGLAVQFPLMSPSLAGFFCMVSDDVIVWDRGQKGPGTWRGEGCRIYYLIQPHQDRAEFSPPLLREIWLAFEDLLPVGQGRSYHLNAP